MGQPHGPLDPRQVEIVAALAASSRVPNDQIVAVPTFIMTGGSSTPRLHVDLSYEEQLNRWPDDALGSDVDSVTA